MNEEDPNALPTPLDRALDAALARVLTAPALPPDFRRRVLATVRAGEQDQLHEQRAALTRAARTRLAELEAGYVRLRRRTLGTLLGIGFACGALLALLMPRLQMTYGSRVALLAAAAATLGAIIVGAVVPWGRAVGAER